MNEYILAGVILPKMSDALPSSASSSNSVKIPPLIVSKETSSFFQAIKIVILSDKVEIELKQFSFVLNPKIPEKQQSRITILF